VTEIIVEDGEQAKRWTSLERVFDALLAARCGRDTLIVALGGGVIAIWPGLPPRFTSAAWPAAGAYHAPCAGGLLGRRQDRHATMSRARTCSAPFTSRAR